MSNLKALGNHSLGLAGTHAFITRALNSGEPFFVGRPGGTESEGLRFFLTHRAGSLAKTPRDYSSWYKTFVKIGPGVSHFNSSDLDYFHQLYLQATLAADLLSYGRFAPGAIGLARRLAEAGTPVSDFLDVEPLLALRSGVTPWTQALGGKKVLVIHPFEESIRNQYAKRTSVTHVSEMLPDFSLDVLRPPVTFGGENPTDPWRVHFTSLKESVKARRFDVALIGAGSYGLPIAHEIRKQGRQAIHLGGTTQLLFGIRGKRWDIDPDYVDFFDETWIRPHPGEKPRGAEKVEGGIYW